MTAGSGLELVVAELEQHAAAAGWDRPAELFALVPTEQLVAGAPELAEQLASAGPLTPVEQEGVAGDDLEALLQQIEWPEAVAGCAAVVERLVLPPQAETELPGEAAAAASYAAQHPDRQEVRIVAAATRDGDRWCALRLRAHDDPESVITGPDLVPGLLDLLRATLDADMESASETDSEADPADGPTR